MTDARRRLGTDGPEVSALGLGCMPMSQFYGKADDGESISAIHRALELGVTFLDTANVYGRGHNEELIGRAVRGRRSDVVVATKFGIEYIDGRRTVNGRPEHVKSSCEESLRRLGSDYIDIYYQHRVDPVVPIEETVGAMAELVRRGSVRHLGLSEANAESLRRASAVHPIAALQSEWSLWTRDLEAEVLPVARQLGIGIVAFSPLGRGFLTGTVRDTSRLAPDDFRASNPRFQPENFQRNCTLLRQLEEVAALAGCSPGQLALAWLLARGDDVVPIPGTKRTSYVEQNAAAAHLSISAEVLATLDDLFPAGAWAGARYDEPDRSAYGGSPLASAGAGAPPESPVAAEPSGLA